MYPSIALFSMLAFSNAITTPPETVGRLIPAFEEGIVIGYQVSGLLVGSKAYDLGLRDGDLIIAVDSSPLQPDNVDLIKRFITKAGTKLTVRRGRNTLVIVSK